MLAAKRMDYVIVENFLSTEQQDQIEQILLGQRFPWTYYANTNYDSGETQPGDTPQFIHGFMRDGSILSNFAGIPNGIMASFGLQPAQIIRAKANLLPWDKTENIHPAHIDDPAPHMVFIYYVNDSDGATCLYDGTNIAVRVAPKKGRGLWFDGNLQHASSSPVQTRFRSVLNFNIRKPVDLDAIRQRWGTDV